YPPIVQQRGNQAIVEVQQGAGQIELVSISIVEIDVLARGASCQQHHAIRQPNRRSVGARLVHLMAACRKAIGDRIVEVSGGQYPAGIWPACNQDFAAQQQRGLRLPTSRTESRVGTGHGGKGSRTGIAGWIEQLSAT